MQTNSLESVIRISNFQACYKPLARVVKRLVDEAPIDPDWYSSEHKFKKLILDLKEEIQGYPNEFFEYLYMWFTSDYLDLNNFIKTGSLESFESSIPPMLGPIMTPNCRELIAGLIMHWYTTSIKLPANCYSAIKYEIAMFRTMLIFSEVGNEIFIVSRANITKPTLTINDLAS